MCYWIENLLCGLKGLDYHGQGREIRIPNISIVVLHGDIEKTWLRELDMKIVYGEFNLMLFPQYWSIITRHFFPQQSKECLQMCYHVCLLSLMMKWMMYYAEILENMKCLLHYNKWHPSNLPARIECLHFFTSIFRA